MAVSRLPRLLPVFLIWACCTLAQAQTRIDWWHAMGRELGSKVEVLVDEFNAGQSDYQVVPVFKGDYATLLGELQDRLSQGTELPHLVQVPEFATEMILRMPQPPFLPVERLMAEHGKTFDAEDFLAPLRSYYSGPDGLLLALPFNTSTPVLFYNRSLFSAAGLDENRPPRTWEELEELAEALKGAGTGCAITSGWPSWILLENFSAWHDLPFAGNGNGFDGPTLDLYFNSPQHVRHISRLKGWSRSGLFRYGGDASEAGAMFLSGECAMYLDSSGIFGAMSRSALPFDVGIGMMPYWAEIPTAPQNSLIGGAAVWVIKGRPAEDYSGVAAFLAYLASTPVQARWHQTTGYLPNTVAAAALTEEQGFYADNPGLGLPIEQLTLKRPTANSRGIRIAGYRQIRSIINEELASTLAGDKDPEAALDDAVQRGQDLLRSLESGAGAKPIMEQESHAESDQ